jgi:hypothetical protein
VSVSLCGVPSPTYSSVLPLVLPFHCQPIMIVMERVKAFTNIFSSESVPVFPRMLFHCFRLREVLKPPASEATDATKAFLRAMKEKFDKHVGNDFEFLPLVSSLATMLDPKLYANNPSFQKETFPSYLWDLIKDEADTELQARWKEVRLGAGEVEISATSFAGPFLTWDIPEEVASSSTIMTPQNALKALHDAFGRRRGVVIRAVVEERPDVPKERICELARKAFERDVQDPLELYR